MAKRRSQYREDDFGKVPSRRKRGMFRKRYLLLGTLVALLLAAFIGIPIAASNRSLIVSAANRFAGIHPIRFDLESIHVGWFSPLQLRGVRLIDERGADIVKVGEVDTELGLWNLATDYMNLRTLTVRGIDMQVDVQPGTTSLEEALRPLMASSPPPVPPTEGATAAPMKLPSGRIRIERAMIAARDSVDLTAWQLSVSEADIPLPTAEQSIPPITLIGSIVQLVPPASAIAAAQGQFTIRTKPIGAPANQPNALPPMQMDIATSGLPLEWYNLVRRRFPSMPIEQITGVATVQAEVQMLTPKNINAKITTAQIDRLALVAPQLVGNQGANMQQIKLSGQVNMTEDRLFAENAILETDVGALGLAASIPTQMTYPTATQPWIPNAQWNVKGTVDLAKLLRVAPGLIPMQQNAQLVSGKATLSSVQTLENGTRPLGDHRIQLGDLVANISGSPMKWEKPLTANVKIEPSVQGSPAISAECQSEFCDLKANGDLAAGSITSSIDLDALYGKLSQWIQLPVQQLSGNASCEIAWKQDTNNRISANGTLSTTPLKIIFASGRLNEPAWKGQFQLIGTLDRGSLIQIDRGSITLDSDSENLKAELMEPFSWMAPAPGAAPMPPAAMTMQLVGDMGMLMRRAEMLASFNPGISVEGLCDVKAQGAIDMNHVEVTAATFSAKQFTMKNESFQVREPLVQGTFSGRADSNDFARLKVDNLLVQAESFALTAKDAAVAGGNGREGKAAFRIDPRSMMSSVASGDGASMAPADFALEGDITGNADWTIAPTTDIQWRVTIDGKDIRVLQATRPAAQAVAPGQLVSTSNNAKKAFEPFWDEPLAKATISGKYDLNTGSIQLPETTLQTVWMAYGGTTAITSDTNQTKIVANGQVTYDAAAVAEKIRPWTGNYLAVVGQRTEPVEVTWVSSSTNASWADALQAKMQIGWDSANLIGIGIGKADVPLEIANGHFISKTTIPVSQGTLRWDLNSDVGATPLIIKQAPEKVLENVAITPQMCQGWLKYVTPLLADVTSVQGQLSLQINRAEIYPLETIRQTIDGELFIHGAQVGPGPLADQLLSIVQQIKALRKGGTAGAANQNTWLQLPEQNIAFNVDQGRVSHKNLQIRAGDVVISTQGSVGIDGQLQLAANVPILKEWVDGTPALAPLAGQNITFPIGGTLQKPQVDFTAFTNVGRQLAESAVQGAITKQFDKGINKLLGPLEQKLAPIQQGIQQNLPQMPQMPQLPNFGIPGFGGGQ